MKRKRLIIAFATVLFAMAVFVVLRQSATAPPMPVYQGKTAKEWLGEIWTSNQKPAMDAFHQMGTNTFPFLINELKSESALAKAARWIFPHLSTGIKLRLPQSILNASNDQNNRWAAAELVLNNIHEAKTLLPVLATMLEDASLPSWGYTFNFMAVSVGPENQEYVPALVRGIASKKDYAMRYLAFNGLQQVGPAAKAALPAVRVALLDSNLDVQVLAAWTLWKIDRDTNAAFPVIKAALNSPGNFSMRDMAPIYLSEIDQTDISVIPLLIEQAKSTNEIMRLRSVLALREYGTAAKEAVPILEQQIQNGSADVRERALFALKKIDPEAAAKYEDK